MTVRQAHSKTKPMNGKQTNNRRVGYKSPPDSPAKFKPGESGNPKGRPKNEKSVTFWLNAFAEMTTQEVAESCEAFAKELTKSKTGPLPIAAIVAARALITLMNDSDSRLLQTVLDRIDGKVTQPIDMRLDIDAQLAAALGIPIEAARARIDEAARAILPMLTGDEAGRAVIEAEVIEE